MKKEFDAPKPPSNQGFKTMFEMLKDAEKYHNDSEREVSDVILDGLCEYIERFKATP